MTTPFMPLTAGASSHALPALPLALSHIHAGFPSPAEEYLEGSLEIGSFLVKRPKTTFFMRVTGESMTGAGIHDGDLLVIDRAAPVADGCIVVAVVESEFCVKVFRSKSGVVRLEAAHPDYPALELTEVSRAEIWGRVMHSITHHCPVPRVQQ